MTFGSNYLRIASFALILGSVYLAVTYIPNFVPTIANAIFPNQTNQQIQQLEVYSIFGSVAFLLAWVADRSIRADERGRMVGKP